MKAALMSRLERLERVSPIDDETNRIDQILLVCPQGSVEPVFFWTRPSLVEPHISLDRRLSRLEQASFLGSQAELDECEFLFMRVPDDYQADPQREKSQAFANQRGKQLICLDTPAARSLLPWAVMPLDRLSDELLDEQINFLERRVSAPFLTIGEHQNEQATH